MTLHHNESEWVDIPNSILNIVHMSLLHHIVYKCKNICVKLMSEVGMAVPNKSSRENHIYGTSLRLLITHFFTAWMLCMYWWLNNCNSTQWMLKELLFFQHPLCAVTIIWLSVHTQCLYREKSTRASKWRFLTAFQTVPRFKTMLYVGYWADPHDKIKLRRHWQATIVSFCLGYHWMSETDTHLSQ